MRSFKQITNTPPPGSRWLFVLPCVLVEAITLLLSVGIYGGKTFEPLWVLPFVVLAAHLVVSFWIARTYAGYLSWLKSALLVIGASMLASRTLSAFFYWQIPPTSPGVVAYLLHLIPSLLMYLATILIIMHIGFVFRRLPFLPKLVDDPSLTICRKCHYDLAGLSDSDRCPECGIESPQTPIRLADRPRSVKAARLGRLIARPIIALMLIRFGIMLVQIEFGYQSTMAKYAMLNPTRPERALDHGLDLANRNTNSGAESRFVLQGVLVEAPALEPFALLIADRTEHRDDGTEIKHEGLHIAIVEIVYNDILFFGRSHVSIMNARVPPNRVSLTPAQAEYLLEHGIPDSLMAALAHRSTFFSKGATTSTRFSTFTLRGGTKGKALPEIAPNDHFPLDPED